MTIYLDAAATSWPKPPEVLTAMTRFLQEDAANPGRSGHSMALRAGAAVRQGRLAVSRFLGISKTERLIFTAGTTDSLNIVLHGFLQPNDRVLITPMEHNSVLRPLAHSRCTKNISVEQIAANEHGRIDLEDLQRRLASGPVRLLCINHASNVNGTIQPLNEILALAKECGSRVLVDGAQSVGVLDFNFDSVDFLAFPGHKGLLGPTGVGGLYVAPDVALPSLRQGGTGSASESEDMPAEWPDAHEAGTLNAVGIVGMTAGVRVLASSTTAALDGELRLARRFVFEARKIDGLRVFSPLTSEQEAVGVVSFTLEAWEPSDLATVLDASFDVALRAGLHCAPRAHQHLRTAPTGTVRVSFGPRNTESDVDHLLMALRSVKL